MYVRTYTYYTFLHKYFLNKLNSLFSYVSFSEIRSRYEISKITDRYLFHDNMHKTGGIPGIIKTFYISLSRNPSATGRPQYKK